MSHNGPLRKQVIYLGHFYSPRMLKTIKEDCVAPIGFPNHNFELSIVRGLSLQPDIDLRVVTIPKVYSYPTHWKKIFTPKEKYFINNVPILSAGLFNLVFLNKLWEIIVTIKVLLNYCHSFNKDQEVCLITNTITFYSLFSIIFTKIITTRKLKTALIVPDIPSMMTSYSNAGRGKLFIMRILDRWTMKYASKMDHLVLLTEQMTDFFPGNQSHIVMEGIVDIDSMRVNEPVKSENSGACIFLYTGTLAKMYGVQNLVKAYMRANMPSSELWICGGGDSVDFINQCASEDSRIKFYGFVSPEKAIELQNMATVLVNPRPCSGQYTKYSFPSKTMEYLLAGKPIIMNKLPGVPNEYFNFIITPPDDSVEGLIFAMEKVYKTPAEILTSLSKKGYEYVVKKKNSVVQTQRILSLFNR